MLLAHKIEIRPNAKQIAHILQSFGIRRHCFNQLLAHFRQDGVKWSKKAAQLYYARVLRVEFGFYSDVSARVSRNAVDDLDNAFKHFFRRCKKGTGKVGFPKFKKRCDFDSFALRESQKFSVDGRLLRIEKMPGRIKMRQALRFGGSLRQVTISQKAGKFYASILVETEDYQVPDHVRSPIVGVDFGLKALATCSDGTIFPAAQKLRKSLKKLKRLSKNLSKKTRESKRRAKTKLSLARLHLRIANQRRAILHEVSDNLTKRFDTIVIEDLDVKSMSKSLKLGFSVCDAGLGTLRSMLEYKAKLRGNTIVIADRWFPSSKTCSKCNKINPLVVLGVSKWRCQQCLTFHDRDLNAALNLQNYCLDTITPDVKRTLEGCKSYRKAGISDKDKCQEARLESIIQ